MNRQPRHAAASQQCSTEPDSHPPSLTSTPRKRPRSGPTCSTAPTSSAPARSAAPTSWSASTAFSSWSSSTATAPASWSPATSTRASECAHWPTSAPSQTSSTSQSPAARTSACPLRGSASRTRTPSATCLRSRRTGCFWRASRSCRSPTKSRGFPRWRCSPRTARTGRTISCSCTRSARRLRAESGRLWCGRPATTSGSLRGASRW
mmetsp:Transcript_25994/g.64959  ORF Transcript_25994/g.64959 Transcript_25994/m.64959 type:complete len:207 (-) Transcript_25994:1412-2032(-)